MIAKSGIQMQVAMAQRNGLFGLIKLTNPVPIKSIPAVIPLSSQLG